MRVRESKRTSTSRFSEAMRLAFSRTCSVTSMCRRYGLSLLEATISADLPMVTRKSVTSSGRSSTRSTMTATSGWLASTALAVCWRSTVLTVRGGATMSPRWPLPMGVIRSMARMDSSEGTVSSRSRSKGWMAVRLSKPEGEGDGAGMRGGTGPRWSNCGRAPGRRERRDRLLMPARSRGHLPRAEPPIDRPDPGAADQDGQGHADEGKVHLVTMPLPRREGPVDEEAVLPVNRGDGHEHDDDEPDRGRPDEEADDHGHAAQELGQRGEHGERGGHAERLLEVRDDAAQAGPAEPAKDLLGAVGEEDDAQDHAHDEQRPGAEGAEEHVHGALLLIRKGDARPSSTSARAGSGARAHRADGRPRCFPCQVFR